MEETAPQASAQRWARLKGVFLEAVELAGTEREAYLEETCGGDTGLRAEVERLLALDEEESVVDGSATADAEALLAQELSHSLLGRRLGRHEVVEEVGRGGMGAVYRGVRADGAYQEVVAIKVLKRGMDSDAIAERFRQERQILASLSHPNIAKLLDGGRTEDGLPYFVMEHIEGVPVDEYCDGRRLGVRERLKLFRAVCSAVQSAHRSLVVHRDLKPGNILVTAEGVPKLLDFGIAKLLDPASAVTNVAATVAGERLMTPEYASPEQVRGQAITTASDVYSLGVVLYGLLTGRSPYRLESLAAHEIERAVCETEPERPSRAFPADAEAASESAAEPVRRGRSAKQVARARHTTPERLCRQLAGDLDNIVLKALDKEPERRYPSVEAFSEDLRRFLVGLPVVARRDTLTYRAAKFLRRHRLGVLASAAVVLSLLGGLAAATWQARLARAERARAEAQREQAETEEATARTVAEFLVELFNLADPAEGRGRAITAREMLEEGRAKLEAGLEDQPEVRATLLETVGVVYRKIGDFEQSRQLLEEALEVRRRLFGEEHPAFASALYELAEALRFQSRVKEAEAMHARALALREASPEVEAAALADSLDGLGLTLLELGRHEEAEALLGRALALRRSTHGAGDSRVVASFNNLGLALRAGGSSQKAEALYREALTLHRDPLGEDHPDLTTVLGNLAGVLRDRGELEEAEELAQRVLALRRRVHGDEHASVATALDGLATVLRRKGEAERARPLFEEALALRRRILGPEHPAVAQSLVNLAAEAHGRGDFTTAEKGMREALAIDRKAYGEHHREVAQVLQNLAVLRYSQGDLAGAEPLFEQALAIDRELLGAEHPAVAAVLNNLAGLRYAQEDHARAAALYSQALEVLRRAYGSEHTQVATTLYNLAKAEHWRGDLDAAEAHFREALELTRRLVPAAHPSLAYRLLGLGELLLARDGLAEAEELLTESLEIRREVLPAGHWETAYAETALGECLLLQGRATAARSHLEAGLRGLRTSLGAEHPHARRAAELLGEASLQRGGVASGVVRRP